MSAVHCANFMLNIAFALQIAIVHRCLHYVHIYATIKQQESLLYFPSIGGVPRHPGQNPRRYRSPSEHNIPFETHNIPCSDGTTIHSWLLYHPNNEQSNTNNKLPTIIFFHGNAGNIGLRLPNAIQMYHYLKANIFLIEYRGYGDSDDAKPTEDGLKLDAEGIMNYINVHANTRQLYNVDPRRLFVFGRSLGGAVAFHMAQYAQQQEQQSTSPSYTLAGIIVENTFLSISEMVDHLMPYVAPFKMLILRMSWNSGKIVPSIIIPTLFLAGAKDTLVPHSHMLELYNRMNKSSKGDNIVRMHIVEDGTHNETWMQGGKEYWMAIQRFIEEVFAAEQANISYKQYGAKTDTIVSRSGNNDGALYQRRGTTDVTAATSTSSSLSSSAAAANTNNNNPIEVDMGCATDAGAGSGDGSGMDAADMIASVGNIIGMAREATKTVAGGVKGSSVLKKKD